MKKRSSRRSEKVRRRLNQESKSWINQASRRLTDPTSSPRNADSDNQSQRSSIRTQAERHNYFFRIGWRLLSFILSAGFAFGIYSLWNDPAYQVTDIEINGLQRIPVESVKDNLEILGKRIFLVDRTVIETQLKRTYPELWGIKVNLIMPNKVSIQLTERQPMIAWNSNVHSLWIDAEGYLIPVRDDQTDLLSINADSLPTYQLSQNYRDEEVSIEDTDIQQIIKDKPVIKGDFSESLFFAFPKQITPNLLTAILQLNAWMPDEKELLYEEVRGVGWKDPRGWNVFIGSKLQSINDKMLMYETIIRQLDKEGIRPAMVSVEFLHAPYYRLEN